MRLVRAWRDRASSTARTQPWSARRAGHGVAVLLKIYAHCIDGQDDAANKRVTDALGAQDTQPEPEPGDEEDDDSAQTS
jgi:hypothetical protein